MYLYLARRDKSSVKMLMVLQGEARSGRVENLGSLGLPPEILETVENEVKTHGLLWEVWIDPAESYHQLKQKLRNRGFSELPISSNPAVNQVRGQTARTSHLPPGRKTMIQKKGCGQLP